MNKENKVKFAVLRLSETDNRALIEFVKDNNLKSKSGLIRQLLKNHVL